MISGFLRLFWSVDKIILLALFVLKKRGYWENNVFIFSLMNLLFINEITLFEAASFYNFKSILHILRYYLCVHHEPHFIRYVFNFSEILVVCDYLVKRSTNIWSFVIRVIGRVQAI